MKPDILGDGSGWENLPPDLEPIVVEALGCGCRVLERLSGALRNAG